MRVVTKKSQLSLFLFVVSLFFVSFGQPAHSCFLGILSSFFGLALFIISIYEGGVVGYQKRGLFFFLWGSGVQCIQLSWMLSFTFQPWAISLGYLFLCLFIGVQYCLWSFLFPLTKKELTFSRILLLSSALVVLEWSRQFLLSGFFWNPLGLAGCGSDLYRQGANFLGIYGLSFLMVMTNIYCVRWYYSRSFKNAVICLLFFCAPYLYGLACLAYYEGDHNKNADISIRVLCVQTAISPYDKLGIAQKRNIFDVLEEQWHSHVLNVLSSRKQDVSYDYVVFPEMTIAGGWNYPLYSLERSSYFFKQHIGVNADSYFPPFESPYVVSTRKGVMATNAFWCQTLANYLKAVVVIGLESSDLEGKVYSSGLVFYPYQPLGLPIYSKQLLVPFGEYLPLSFLKSWMRQYGIEDSYAAGTRNVVYQGRVPFSISICYEELCGALVRQSRTEGASFFMNLTNDAWFPYSLLARQHFEHAKIRCVENGVPLIRSCNTGVTAALDSFGREIQVFGDVKGPYEWKSGCLDVIVPLYSYQTCYSYFGNYPLIVFTSFYLVGYLIFLLKSFRKM